MKSYALNINTLLEGQEKVNLGFCIIVLENTALRHWEEFRTGFTVKGKKSKLWDLNFEVLGVVIYNPKSLKVCAGGSQV